MKSLHSQINGLSISSDGVIPCNSHLMGSQMKRPLNVTPNVAATTAAALNAERSAQKFKRVLLATRSSPLLSNKVAQVSVPTSFQMPQKPSMVKPDPETPACIFSLPATPVMTFRRHLRLGPRLRLQILETRSHRMLTRHRGGNKHHPKMKEFRLTVIFNQPGFCMVNSVRLFVFIIPNHHNTTDVT